MATADSFGLIVLLFSFVGAAYLFLTMIMAVKQRGMIAWIALFNVLVFVYMILFTNPAQFLQQNALSYAKIAAGQGFTLISYMFVHANLTHIVLNTFALLYFGYNMEKEFGAAPTVMVYIVSGLIAGAFYVFTSSPQAMVVGASGAIFGLMGYLTLLRPFKISPMPFLVPIPVALATVIYAILIIPTFVTGDFAKFGNVAQGAHLGGLLGGSLLAFGMNWGEALKGLIVVILIASLVIVLPPLFA